MTSLAEKYVPQIEHVIDAFDPNRRNRYFVFGSAVRSPKFRDFDLGVIGTSKSGANLSQLRDRFYEASIPYTVDVVDFDTADREFTDYVQAQEPILWIR